MRWTLSLALVLGACSPVATPPLDAGHHDAFVTRDAWRVGIDAHIDPPDMWMAPPDASTWTCVVGLAQRTPLPQAVVGLVDQELSLRIASSPPITFEVCHEPTCAAPVRSITATTTDVSIVPPLEPGRYYWRARDAVGAVTPPWSFRVASSGAHAGRRPVDISGDGLADVVMIWPDLDSPGNNVLGIWLGQSGSEPLPWMQYNTSNASWVQQAGDANGDGVADVVMGGDLFSFFSWGYECPRLNSGGGISRTSTGWPHGGTDLGDADGDGLDDALEIVATAGASGPCVLTAFYGQTLVASTRTHVVASEMCAYPFSIAAAPLVDDWSGDGLPDLVVGVPATGEVHLYSPAPTGSSTPFLVIHGPSADAEFGSDVIDAGDLDGDGVREVAVIQLMPSGVATFNRLGAQRAWLDLPVAVSNLPRLAALGDFDLDGFDDLAIGGDPYVYIAFGGVGGPTLVMLADLSAFSSVAAPGDIDGDGAPDLVASSQTGVVIYRGGTRTPRELARLPGTSLAYDVAGH